jgi:hypothetical protein
MAQIKGSPKIDTDKPISRQHEMDLYKYYPWGNYYWGNAMGFGGMGISYLISINLKVQKETVKSVADKSEKDTHLRSTHEVIGYNIKANYRQIIDKEYFIFNNKTFAVDFMEVNTGDWFPGKKVLVSPRWIKEINWETSSVIVNPSEDQVKNSPEYVPSKELNDSYEAELNKYYGFITHK